MQESGVYSRIVVCTEMLAICASWLQNCAASTCKRDLMLLLKRMTKQPLTRLNEYTDLKPFTDNERM